MGKKTVAKSTFSVICAWCGKILSSLEGTTRNSHGICESCSERIMSAITQDK